MTEPHSMRRELWQCTFSELHALLKDADISAVDLVRTCQNQIKAWEHRVHAFVSYDLDGALARAQQLDATRDASASAPDNPLFAIPIGYKDMIDIAGWPTKAGGRVYGETPARRNAYVVDQLLGKHTVTIGKTTTHELAAGVVTPGTANPFDHNVIAGGSSGGSAVAVATGMVFGGIGTDTGGSGRIPAAICGVVGFKPTFGEIGRSGILARSPSLDTVAFLAKFVDDVRLLFEAALGVDSEDPSTYRPSGPRDHARVRGETVRIGYPKNWVETWAASEVRGWFEEQLSRLERSGYEIVPIHAPSLSDAIEIRRNIIRPETAAVHRKEFVVRAAEFGEDVSPGLRAGMHVLAVDYIEAKAAKDRYAEAFDRIFTAVDYVATPSIPIPSPRVGADTVELGSSEMKVIDALTLFTSPFNLAGLPAISLPCGLHNNLPVGLQLVGQRFGDNDLLTFASSVQRKTSPVCCFPTSAET